MKSEKLSRRQFLDHAWQMALAIPLVAACGGNPAEQTSPQEINAKAATALEVKMGITDKTTRAELQAALYDKAADPAFLVNDPNLITFTNQRNSNVTVGTAPDGEPVFSGDVTKVPFVYDYANPIGQDFQIGNIKAQILGPTSFVNAVNANQQQLADFAEGYFGSANIKGGLIVNALPVTQKLKVANLDLAWPSFYPRGGVFRGFNQATNEASYGVVLNINRLHITAQELGLTLEQLLRQVAINEGAGLLNFLEGDKRGMREPRSNPGATALTTVSGWASAFKPTPWADRFGGSAFTGFMNLVSSEMGSVKQRPLPAQ